MSRAVRVALSWCGGGCKRRRCGDVAAEGESDGALDGRP